MSNPTSEHPALRGARALLVDLDGTLVDSSQPVHRAWTAFADRHGLDGRRAFEFAQGRPSRETVRLLAPAADPVVEAELLEHAELTDTHGIVALPGAAALLRSGRRLAIVTLCSGALAGVRLEAAGLPRPEIVITSDMVEHGKPDPEPFLLAARKLHVAPHDSVAFEDAPTGIAAARAAGARVVAVRTTHVDDDLAEADMVVDDLAALFTTHRGRG